jgi:glutamyl-tRNA reductase
MEIIVVGISHRTAPVTVREKVAFTADEIAGCLAELRRVGGMTEAVLLSTCNRVEIYGVSAHGITSVARITEWLATRCAMDTESFGPLTYQHVHAAAIAHGFRVAASLDSMILGETQILGQVKHGFQQAVAAGTTGKILNRYFQRTFQVAKRVRSETTIAEQTVSVASAAVTLAQRIFGPLNRTVCLLIGAGEMCELAARYLIRHGVEQMMVTNRTFARAQELAATFNDDTRKGHAIPLDDLADQLDRADIVISSTGSPHPLVTVPMVKAALKRRRQRPMFFIDIAVPRDIEPAVAELDSAFLYDIDDLQHVVEGHLQHRQRAATEAEQIILAETPLFLQWMETLEIAPTITAIRDYFEQVRQQELARLLGDGTTLPAREQERLEAWSRQLVNKLLHRPMTRLRSLAAEEDGDTCVIAARRMFTDDTPDHDLPHCESTPEARS